MVLREGVILASQLEDVTGSLDAQLTRADGTSPAGESSHLQRAEAAAPQARDLRRGPSHPGVSSPSSPCCHTAMIWVAAPP